MLEWRFSEREFSGGSLGSISIIFHLTGKQQIKAFFVISSQPYELELYRISPPKYCSPVHQNDDEVWTLSMRAKTINDQFFKFRITDVSMKKFQRWRRTVNYSPLCRVFIYTTAQIVNLNSFLYFIATICQILTIWKFFLN